MLIEESLAIAGSLFTESCTARYKRQDFYWGRSGKHESLVNARGQAQMGSL